MQASKEDPYTYQVDTVHPKSCAHHLIDNTGWIRESFCQWSHVRVSLPHLSLSHTYFIALEHCPRHRTVPRNANMVCTQSRYVCYPKPYVTLRVDPDRRWLGLPLSPPGTRIKTRACAGYTNKTCTLTFHACCSWLYRIRPAVAHQGFTALPTNPDVSVVGDSDVHAFWQKLIARIQLPSHQSKSSLQPYPACLASIWYPSCWSRFCGWVEDACGQWRSYSSRRPRSPYICSKHVDEKEGVCK